MTSQSHGHQWLILRHYLLSGISFFAFFMFRQMSYFLQVLFHVYATSCKPFSSWIIVQEVQEFCASILYIVVLCQFWFLTLGRTVLKSQEHVLDHNVAAFWIKARNKFQNHLQSLPFYLRNPKVIR
jgi:hypothetical protein